jgi:hypothetical protein
MKITPPRWPNGTGQWNRLPTTTIVAGDQSSRALLERLPPDTELVVTLLDMIARLEDDEQPIARLVLVGALAEDPEIARVLRELYPSIEVIDHRAFTR